MGDNVGLDFLFLLFSPLPQLPSLILRPSGILLVDPPPDLEVGLNPTWGSHYRPSRLSVQSSDGHLRVKSTVEFVILFRNQRLSGQTPTLDVTAVMKKTTAEGFKDGTRQKKDKCKWFGPEEQERNSTGENRRSMEPHRRRSGTQLRRSREPFDRLFNLLRVGMAERNHNIGQDGSPCFYSSKWYVPG